MITTHYTSNDRIYNRMVRIYSESEIECIELIQKYPDINFNNFMNENIEALAEESFRNGESEQGLLYLNRAAQLGMGIFQSNAHNGVAFPFAFDDEYIEVVGKKTCHDTDESDWLKALFCAIIRRNNEAINFLMTVENEVFSASSMGPQNTQFDYALVDLFRAVFSNGNLASALKTAMTSFDPNIYHEEAYLYVSRLKWPLVAIIKAIFSADAEVEFNQAMEKALNLHKEYYSPKEKFNHKDFYGVIPLGLTALAALAYDHKEYKVMVENEYIPKWLVEIDR